MHNSKNEYYQSKDIVLRYDVYKDGDTIHPSSSIVKVYDPDKQFIGHARSKTVGSEVRCKLDGKKVEKVGKYTFIFDVTIRDLGDYTHIVKVDVKKLPI